MQQITTERETRSIPLAAILDRLKLLARDFGFQQLAVAGIELDEDERHLNEWLRLGRHGQMRFMAHHGTLRTRPAELVPGTRRVVSVRMNYYPASAAAPEEVLDHPRLGYVSRYALGRDYHRLMRRRLQRLVDAAQSFIGPFGYRVFVDSAPVLEKALARKAGIGWMGKHTNVIHRDAGSWFFLGEIFTDLPLPVDAPASEHCGSCRACIDICPTRAIEAPYRLDARRCISYLTIEHPGSIPEPLRAPIGNRIYGCDDCQLICPWNRHVQVAGEADFAPRGGMDAPDLCELFAWEESGFLRRTEGTPIRRIGHLRWMRNVAVALGNAESSPSVVAALRSRASHPSEMVREHVDWALSRHQASAFRHRSKSADA